MLKTQKVIHLKDGSVLPLGLPVSFNKCQPSRCFVKGNRAEPYQVRVTSAFNKPSETKLAKWAGDSICQSISGERVELDGWDRHYSPSWMLALGLV